MKEIKKVTHATVWFSKKKNSLFILASLNRSTIDSLCKKNDIGRTKKR